MMSQSQNDSPEHQLFHLYHTYRYQHQKEYYTATYQEFQRSYNQAMWISIALMAITALCSGLSAITIIPSSIQLICMVLTAILPVLSTAIAAFSNLYGFEQQAKLYQDTINALLEAHVQAPEPGLPNTLFAQRLEEYIKEVEKVFNAEQGQWGQLAKKMKPPD